MMKVVKIENELKKIFPFDLQTVNLKSKKSGLIIVDLENGFCTVGAGNLAPQKEDESINNMLKEVNDLARLLVTRYDKKDILIFLDTHKKNKPEWPYEEHCVQGTGEENLVSKLKWLENHPKTKIIRKDCVNGFIGAFDKKGNNALLDWINNNKLEVIIVVGICTEICVMNLVLSLISLYNCEMIPSLGDENIVVYTPGCATYQSDETERSIREHMAFYYMQAQGAILANKII